MYVGSNKGMIYAIKGGKIWEYKTEDMVRTSPLIDSQGIVYAGNDAGKMYALRNGEKLWEFETGGGIHSSPAIDSEGTIYFGCEDRKLYAVKTKSQIQEAFEKNDTEQERDLPSIVEEDEWIIIGDIKLNKKSYDFLNMSSPRIFRS
ncbi:MAG: PQQ-binding-like beta-propeller repeat protein [Vulcanimicrobiota bacterium]